MLRGLITSRYKLTQGKFFRATSSQTEQVYNTGYNERCAQKKSILFLAQFSNSVSFPS